jgi:phthalate 4,5-dioxygenase oxygenase subunit
MLSAESNELLTRVANNAPMGRLMRRHWIPVCMLEEVAEPDGTPIRIRILGEDLVAFRDSNGRLGVLDDACPHRRVSLALGRNEECGLRCLFHGWKIDVDGNIVDMQSEDLESGARPRMKHRAYPIRESGGFVWIYMGELSAMPEFVPPPWAKSENIKVVIAKFVVHANWAQITEGGIDSAHSSSLHSSSVKGGAVARAQPAKDGFGAVRPSNDKAPRLEVQLTSYGLRYAAIRKPIENADAMNYVRVTAYVAPFTVLIPPNARYASAQIAVPMDDENSVFYFFAFGEGEGMIDQEKWRKIHGGQVGIDLDSNYRMVRTRENNYAQDRSAMKLGDFSGIYGVPNQDIAMWETMGPIADRTKEVLGKTDLAVAQFRTLMVDAARVERDGAVDIARLSSALPITEIQSFEGVVAKSVNWRTLAVSEREQATFYERSAQRAVGV